VIGEVVGGTLPLWFRSQGWLMGPLPLWAAPLLASQPGQRSYQLSLLFAGLIAAPSLAPLFLLREPRRPNAERQPGRASAGDLSAGGPNPGRPQGEHIPGGGPTPGYTQKEHIPADGPAPGRPQGVPLHIQLAVVTRLIHTPFFFLTLVYILTGLGAGLVIPYFNIF